MSNFSSKFKKGIALFLPGIFLLGFNIGTGSVTSMAKAGSSYGMELLWTIVASCLATYFMISLYGRYTLVTGETALSGVQKTCASCICHILYSCLNSRSFWKCNGSYGYCCGDLL